MRQLRFRRCERLLSPAQYKHVYAQRSVIKSAWVWIYKASNGLPHSRLGISISNRICPHLVARNRVKRILREIFRLHKDQFGKGKDIVMVVKSFPPVPRKEEMLTHILRLVKSI